MMLLLTTPAQHQGENPTIELNPKKLKQWIAALPTHDVIDTVSSLQNAIAPFNEIKVNYDVRLKCLEVYRNAFEEILFFYDDLRLRQLPIQAQQRKSLSEDIMWLYLELATGYKIIIKELTEANVNPKRNQRMLIAMYRAMELIIHALIYAVRAQHSAPQLTCLEINQLYSLAEEHDVLRQKVRPNGALQAGHSIDSLYKQFILLTMADPYKLSAGELMEFFIVLAPFAAHCHISKISSLEKIDSGYLIDLMEDRPPIVRADYPERAPAAHLRSVDTADVVNQLRLSADDAQAMQAKGLLSAEKNMLKILANNIKNRSGTISLAAPCVIHAKCIIGFDALCHFLSNNSTLPEALQFSRESHHGIEVQNTADNGAPPFEIFNCAITHKGDENITLLMNPLDYPDELSGSNILGIVKPDNNGMPLISVALIKRIDKNADGSVKILINQLPDLPQLITYSLNAGTHTISAHKGLYFPRCESPRKPASLLIESNYYFEGSNLFVHLQNQTHEIIQSNIINHSTLFTQFRFKVAARQPV